MRGYSVRAVSGLPQHNQPGVDPVWRASSMYRYQFLIFTVFALIGVLLNGVCLLSFLRIDHKHQNLYHNLNVAVTMIDFVFLITVATENAYHYVDGEYLGLVYPAFCMYDAIVAYIFALWSICLIACIAHVIKLQLCQRYVLTRRDSFLLILGSGLDALSASVCIIVFIGGGASVTRSGNFCMANNSAFSVIAVNIAGYTPLGWLAYSFYHIYFVIRDSQRMLTQAGMKGQAKLQHIKGIKRLGYFLVSIGVCETPLMAAAGYQCFGPTNVPGWLFWTAGIFSLFYSSLMNPIIFILLNVQLREAVDNTMRRLFGPGWKF